MPDVLKAVPPLVPIVIAPPVSPLKIPSSSVDVIFVSPNETASPATTSSLSRLVTNKVLLGAPVVAVSPAKFTSPNLMSYPSF